MADKALSTKALTTELRKLGAIAHTTKDDGTVLTKEQALAEQLWNRALGYEERYRDENGKWVKKVHPPEAWAAQYVFERLEGKVAQAEPEKEATVKAVDKVRDLAKDRLNKLALIAAGPPPMKP